MNQLFTIMLRWLVRDKKRTALTLASITLSVFMVSFVGVYLSSAVSAMHMEYMYQSPEHASIHLDSLSQAEKLDKNAAWDSHAVVQYDPMLFFSRFINEYADKEGCWFPNVYINGKSAFSAEKPPVSFRAEAVGGDFEKLQSKSNFSLADGSLPQHSHEAAVSLAFSREHGIGIGDRLNIRFEVREGRFYCAGTDIAERIGERISKDTDGNIIYTEDTDGSRLRDIYNFAVDDEDYGTGVMLKMLNMMYSDEEARKNMGLSSYNGFTIIPARAELSEEVADSFEYTAVVTGLIDGGSQGSAADMLFSSEDSDITSAMTGRIDYRVRVKENIDAEETVAHAAKAIGAYKDGDNTGYSINGSLLVTEGRQLEYVLRSEGMLVIFIVVVGLFTFLARLIINNAFEIGAAYRTEQYGALKTIGASDKQIFTMIMFECAMYMLVAMPAGVGLAIGIGKILMTKVKAIAVFDPIYGEGISDEFFTLELSPAVMWITFAVALFSVFFSAYADAMRVMRLPPIQSARYSSSKRRIRGGRTWISRRLFGYPFGFAVKCISKQKVRFAVTLLAAVMSGIFIVSISGIAEAYAKKDDDTVPFKYDLEIWDYNDHGSTIEQSSKYLNDTYEKLRDTGYFETVIPECITNIRGQDSNISELLSDEYVSFCSKYEYSASDNSLSIVMIPREDYDKYITSDMTYDEFAASGKVLLCQNFFFYDETAAKDGSVVSSYKTRDGMVITVPNVNLFKDENIDSIEITSNHYDAEKAEEFKIEESIPVAGLYSTDFPEYMGCYGMTAIAPIESRLDFLKQSGDERLAENRNIMAVVGAFKLNADKSKLAQARAFLHDEFELENGDAEVIDYTAQDAFAERGSKALKIAGFGFGAALAAVVLLNIFSTMSANMINRRRDLSMMRSCGMSMRQVTASVVIESSFYAVITSVVSTLAGRALSQLILEIFGDDMVSAEGGVLLYLLKNKTAFMAESAAVLFAVIMLVMALAYVPALIMMSRTNIAEEIRTDL
ncbi:FtsX-like permease family protein [Ruminococcus sp. YE71]|uniref:ABC transporter permease n=1 Tax=unclassified Ruminococcus TaxID=2608920 RepID=UPI00088DDE80|nr:MULTISPECIES: FtsX-like permease family protein [unclassified Ruminococcus]SDA17150.1 FtsX-like permease family protein [Ruminococcus sp. YE78]SFW26309.1 FtsX-like permease family protein [Ruminococcus sp. YE71]